MYDQRIARTVQQMYIVYVAIGLSMLAVTGVFIYLVEMQKTQILDSIDQKRMNDLFEVLVPVLAISIVFVGTFFYKKRSGSTLLKEGAFEEKIRIYKTSMLVVWATLEAPVLLAAMVYFLTTNKVLLIVILLLMAWYVLNRPSARRLIQDFNLEVDA